MEELRLRHQKEQRDLQSRIAQKKKNATKKTRKGVHDECGRMQRELDEHQQSELAALNPNTLSDDLQELSINGNSEQSDIPKVSGEVRSRENEAEVTDQHSTTRSGESRGKKPNRQKARLARRAAEQEALAARAAEEAALVPDLRAQEIKRMQSLMEENHLTEINIEADGHCLYSAVAINLPSESLPGWAPKAIPYQLVRNNAGSFIAENPTDFAPFLEEPIDQYVHKIKHTAEWGGQLELQAIARSLGVEIRVLQADGRIERIEPDSPSKYDPIWLAYYRHSFGLGEHYNALRKQENT